MPCLRVNGINFYFEETGSGEPLIMLHGFTGSSESWSTIADELAEHFRMITIDLIGHGRSDAPPGPSRYAFATAIEDLVAIARQLGVETASWLGYSLGGRLALGLAMRHPGLVSALVLESASPGIAEATQREDRRRADEALADRIEIEGIAEFVSYWELLPLWQSRTLLPVETQEQQRVVRLRNRPAGLAGSLRGMSAGAQDSLWERLPDVRVPTLLVAGALDGKFATIAGIMATAMPNAELCLMPNAGHTVHLERPDRFVEAVVQFLELWRVRKRNQCEGNAGGN